VKIHGLVSFGLDNPQRAGMLGVALGEQVLDCAWVQAHLDAQVPTTMQAYLKDADAAWARIQRLIERLPSTAAGLLPRSQVRLEAPVGRPGKILAIGLNYREHIDEQSARAPEEPLVFVKLSSSVIADGEAIVVPAASASIDYEGELGVVIGRRCRNVALAQARSMIAGYTILNDVTARDLQRKDRQWTRAKGFDTFCPQGPWLLPRQLLADPQALRLETRVNGELRQQSSTARMITPIDALIVYLSSFCTLEPGDLIATGTPSGVGAYREPPEFLQAGDVVEVSIEGLGCLTNPVR
jgi:2-keto-4-pentenoate hydratase/2-oxohepta-3-ene-1,7-dioic acid hydratase in catechol pathway